MRPYPGPQGMTPASGRPMPDGTRLSDRTPAQELAAEKGIAVPSTTKPPVTDAPIDGAK